MTLVAGAKLGRYEIRSKIGADGMGEGYLAPDTDHDAWSECKPWSLPSLRTNSARAGWASFIRRLIPQLDRIAAIKILADRDREERFSERPH